MTDLPIRWPDDGLIPVVIQEESTQTVLMVGFVNAEALNETLRTGLVHFWSRSRQELWQKGATSGHVQRVREVRINCDLNSLLIEVEQVGAVCHDGYPTCYYRRLDANGSLEIVRERQFDPGDVYGTTSTISDTELIQRWWGAYEYLKEYDLEAESGTSRLLRMSTDVVARIGDELRELAGVLDGSHVHRSQEEDVVLEGSQVAYWLVVHALQRDCGLDDLSLPSAMLTQSGDVGAEAMSSVLRSRADRVREYSLSPAEIHELFALVAQSTIALGITPIELIRTDFTQLREKPYLEGYFAR